ncbi:MULTISPECIES: AraC family transcriptional regulator [unclassified Mesorhizobium]|uniref:helix-turn-helix domain-containing protein n=1 Tax=unclassified Mesorhizobium TaxID=325217 RepID=UPI0033353271
MLFIPLPFVVAILLLILFVIVVRRDDDAPPNVPFLALILVSVVQSTLLGLRWGYSVNGVSPILPVVAATIPPLIHAGVSRLVRKSALATFLRIGLHVIPAVGIVILIVVWPDAIDIAVASIFVGYAIAILLLTRSGADALRLAPFENAGPAYRAILLAASVLLVSAAMDIVVFFDFEWTRGEHTPLLVTIGNLALLVVLSIAVAAASRRGMPAQTIGPTPILDIAEDTATIAAIQVLMETKRVYRDVDLNLDRLARKAGIPARQISTAINRATGKNVSQYVNDYRIAEACSLLRDTKKPVTEIMFDVGFLTKSNFNREFRRVTESTPQEWRRTKAEPD